MDCDVAIVGGGPAGSTVGALLKRYNPALDVVILEREHFPRDHVGESLLPLVCEILAETGAWGKVEAANFPVKIGATYRWGKTDDLWQFEFLPGEPFYDIPRPSQYAGQRAQTAFQVDRSIFDEILLDHAVSLGCRVFEGTKVSKVLTEGDRIEGLDTDGPEQLTARYYVDASGVSGLFQRALQIGADSPTLLRNIAIWDYWQNADWALRVGVGGTKISIMSLGWGWLWFIPMGPTRTSVGLVTSAEYFKNAGKTTDQIYSEAIAAEPTIAKLVENGHRENSLQTTRDWSYVADRIAGENWLMVGDSCGFADPILSAGITLAMSGARKAAFTILELDRARHDSTWLKTAYNDLHRKNIGNHIRFADYWYSANAIFTELKEYCAEIARDAGLELTADAAFRWLGTGGFTEDNLETPYAASFRLGAVKGMAAQFTGEASQWLARRFNLYQLDLNGAEESFVPNYHNGVIDKVRCYRRDKKILPIAGMYQIVIEALQWETEATLVAERVYAKGRRLKLYPNDYDVYASMLETLEAMIADGWIKGSEDPDLMYLRLITRSDFAAQRQNRR